MTDLSQPVTRADIAVLAAQLCDDKSVGVQKVRSVFRSFGTERLSDFKPDDYPKLLVALLNLRGGRLDLTTHMQRVVEFSSRTFGPGERTLGIIDHIHKETKELLDTDAMPYDTPESRRQAMLAEWIDVVILALDGCWRTGSSPEEITAALLAKQETNEGRKWPDWRTMTPDQAIEHDRSHDEADGR